MKPGVLRSVGGTIRRLRRQQGLSQEALAERADLVQHYVSRIETGDAEPGLLVLLRLCRALRVSPSELLSDFTVSRLDRLRLK